jgi:hypothetical protein
LFRRVVAAGGSLEFDATMVDGSCKVSGFQSSFLSLTASAIAVVSVLLLDFAKVNFVTVWCFHFAMKLYCSIQIWVSYHDRLSVAGCRCLFPAGLTRLILQ